MAGLILEAAMDLHAVDVERFEVGRFGDFRFQKRGGLPKLPPTVQTNRATSDTIDRALLGIVQLLVYLRDQFQARCCSFSSTFGKCHGKEAYGACHGSVGRAHTMARGVAWQYNARVFLRPQRAYLIGYHDDVDARGTGIL